jgi:hypothetical protein
LKIQPSARKKSAGESTFLNDFHQEQSKAAQEAISRQPRRSLADATAQVRLLQRQSSRSK